MPAFAPGLGITPLDPSDEPLKRIDALVPGLAGTRPGAFSARTRVPQVLPSPQAHAEPKLAEVE